MILIGWFQNCSEFRLRPCQKQKKWIQAIQVKSGEETFTKRSLEVFDRQLEIRVHRHKIWIPDAIRNSERLVNFVTHADHVCIIKVEEQFLK